MSEKGVWYRLVKGKEGMNGLSNINFFSVIFLNST